MKSTVLATNPPVGDANIEFDTAGFLFYLLILSSILLAFLLSS